MIIHPISVRASGRQNRSARWLSSSAMMLTLLIAGEAVAQNIPAYTTTYQRSAWYRSRQGGCPGGEVWRPSIEEVGIDKCAPHTYSHVDQWVSDPLVGDIWCLNKDTGEPFIIDTITHACGGEGVNCEFGFPAYYPVGDLFSLVCEKTVTTCPKGYNYNGAQCVLQPHKYNTAKNLGDNRDCSGCSVGNPVQPAFGNKHQVEVDYVGVGEPSLSFVRTYNSTPSLSATMPDVGFGAGGWTHTYHRRVVETPTAAWVFRPDGKTWRYTFDGAAWVGDADATDVLEEVVDEGTGDRIGWRYTAMESGEIDVFDIDGFLTRIENRAGRGLTVTHDVNGAVTSVTDPTGRSLTFNWSGGRILSMTDPTGAVTTYAQPPTAQLASVTYPDGTTRGYSYVNNNFMFLLSSITDANGQVVSSWQYAPLAGEGIVVRSSRGDGRETFTFTYPDDKTIIVDPYGQTRTYNYGRYAGSPALTSIIGDACPECGPKSSVFDANAYRTRLIDWNDNRTDFTRDASGLLLSHTSGLTAAGATTVATRSVDYVWDTTLRAPTEVTYRDASGTAVRRDRLTYGADGNLITRTVDDLVTSGSLTITRTYDDGGRLVAEDGPRDDVDDVSLYEYWPDDASCPVDEGGSPTGCRGMLYQETNPLGHARTFAEYRVDGLPTLIIDENGVATRLTYDVRGRVTDVELEGATTHFDYDLNGQLTSVQGPDGSETSYVYDSAGRLAAIDDGVGNRQELTYDAAGNPVRLDTIDFTAALISTREWVYDARGRIAAITEGETCWVDLENVPGAVLESIMHFDGPDGSTVFPVDGGSLAVAYGNAQVSTARSKLGGASALFDGAGDYLEVDTPKSTGFGLDNFTFETWVYLEQDNSIIVDMRPPSTNGPYFMMVAESTALRVYVNGLIFASSATGVLNPGAWHHVAYTRGAGVGHLFLNGTEVATKADPTVYVGNKVRLGYGAYNTGWLRGSLDEARVTVGVARYTASFTPPDAPLVVDNGGADGCPSSPLRVTRFEYDAQGNLTAMTDGLGRRTTYDYDRLNRRVATHLSDGATESMAYDLFNRMTSFTDAGGHVTAWTYSAHDDLIEISSPDKGTETRTYDGAGNVLTSTDAAGHVVTYTYDALNRPTSISSSDGGESTFTYDLGAYGVGRLSEVTDDAGTRRFGYDSRGRIILEERTINSPLGARSFSTEYAYDAADRLIAMRYPSGRWLEYTRDASGRVSAMTSDSAALVSNIYYGPFRRLESATLPGGAALLLPVGLHGNIESYNVGAAVRALSWDDAGQLAGQGGQGAPWTYERDQRGRVIGAVHGSSIFGYAYDANGNLTSAVLDGSATAFSIDTNTNRLISASGGRPASYSYTPTGNTASDGQRAYTYDARNRLVEIQVGASSVAYSIDTYGNRVARVVQ